MKTIDLTNQIFERLTVVAQDKSDSHGHTKWACVCACGRETKAFRNSLVKGQTKSCGCLRIEKTKERHRLRKEQKNEVPKS